MTKYVGSNQRLNKKSGNNIVVGIIGSLILMLGVVSVFAPQLLELIMSPSDAKLLSEYGVLLIVVGLILELIPVWSKVQQHRQQRSHSTSQQQGAISSMSVGMDTTVINYDANNTQEALFEDIDLSSAPSVDWSPLKRGGANFKTHKLVVINSDCMEFHASTGMLLFSILFAAIGGIVGTVFLISANEIIPALFGFLFVGIGIGIYYFASTPRVFDKQLGYYWKGRCKQRRVSAVKNCKDYVVLKDIYGLQIVSEYVRGDKSSYHSYELNLVLHNGQRINVVDHGSRKQINKDAEELSRFLGVPVIQQS